MTSFRIPISERSKAVARFVGDVYEQITCAFSAEQSRSALTQVELADKLGVNKSVVSRELKGATNLTIRRVAELAWALGYEIEFRFRRRAAAATIQHTRRADSGLMVIGPAPLLSSNRSAASLEVTTLPPLTGSLGGRIVATASATVRRETCH